MRYLSLFFLSLFSTSTFSAVYHCVIDGVPTYSQTPCANDAKEITVSNSTSQTPQTVNQDVIKQCTELAKKAGNYRDPNSFIVLHHEKIWLSDKSGARQVLAMKVNAKNGYGGYGEAKPFNCFLNHNGTGLSQVQKLIF